MVGDGYLVFINGGGILNVGGMLMFFCGDFFGYWGFWIFWCLGIALLIDDRFFWLYLDLFVM